MRNTRWSYARDNNHVYDNNACKSVPIGNRGKTYIKGKTVFSASRPQNWCRSCSLTCGTAKNVNYSKAQNTNQLCKKKKIVLLLRVFFLIYFFFFFYVSPLCRVGIDGSCTYLPINTVAN